MVRIQTVTVEGSAPLLFPRSPRGHVTFGPSSRPPSKEGSRGASIVVSFRPPWDLDACPSSPMLIMRYMALSKVSRGVLVPIKNPRSSKSWKIKDTVSCKYPYLQAKSTFEPKSYKSEADWSYQQLEDDLWIKINTSFSIQTRTFSSNRLHDKQLR